MNRFNTFSRKYAYGFLETRGMTSIINAVDNMLKGANIELIGLKRYGSAYMTAAIKGNTDDVINAINIGKKSVNNIVKKNSQYIACEGISQLISTHIISQTLFDIIDTFFYKPPGTDISIINKSLGFLDARGLIALIAAADKITKNTPAKILGYHQMGSGRLNLIITGNIDEVKHAVELGVELIKEHGKLIGNSIIANPNQQLLHMLK